MSEEPQFQEEYREMVDRMNEAVADSIEQNMQAQAEFVESWADTVDDSIPEPDTLSEGMEGYAKAYEVWMETAEQLFERTSDAAQGEDVDPSEFRDLWLQSANQAFKEVMSTSAFAKANGQLVEVLMELQQDVDDLSQDTIASVGMATRDDVEEVGERLVELERRQHAVESKLDRVLEVIEE